MGNNGLVRYRDWIWDFSSTHSTNALSGGSNDNRNQTSSFKEIPRESTDRTAATPIQPRHLADRQV